MVVERTGGHEPAGRVEPDAVAQRLDLAQDVRREQHGVRGREPAEQAMEHAEVLIASYVAAGFKKIHLDCSMSCLGDPVPLPDELVAERAARLLAALPPTAILSSDLVRASDTAEALSRWTGLEVLRDPDLRETNGGSWQGHLGGFLGQNEIPRVAGQHYEYLVKQLTEFKAGKRTVFEVLDSRMVVFTMQKNAVNGRYEQMRAGYGILRNMGRLVEAAVNSPAG